jgi:uncharacterized membrane protein YgcG
MFNFTTIYFTLDNFSTIIINLIGNWIIFCGNLSLIIVSLIILFFTVVVITKTTTFLTKKPGLNGIATGIGVVVGITQLIDFAQRQQDRKARPNPPQPGKGTNGGSGGTSGSSSGTSGGQASKSNG